MTQAPNKVPQFLTVLLALLVTATFLYLAERTPSIEDTIGYTLVGEQLASGEGLALENELNARIGPYFTTYAYLIRREPGAALYFGFPPGFPLLMGLGALIHHPFIVVPLLAGAGLVFTYLLGRLSTGEAWTGFWAALLLAFTPAYWQFGTAAWSEIPALLFIAAGFAFYLFSRQPSMSRRVRLGTSVAAALLLGYSFFIRYANVSTVLAAIALYETFDIFRQPRGFLKELTAKWRWPFLLLLGLALLTIPIFNHIYYGGALITNYSPIHGWYPHPPFSLTYALGPSFVNGFSLRAVLQTIWHNFTLLALLIPIGWWILARHSLPTMALHAAGALATLGLYSVYAFAASGINSRFLLPAYPLLTVSIAAALLSAAHRLPGSRWRWSAGLLLLALLSLSLPGQISELRNRNANGSHMVAHVEEIVRESESDAVFLSYVFNDQIVYYGQRTVLNYRRIPPSDAESGRFHWEIMEPCLKAMVTILLEEEGRPVYYVLDQSPSYLNSLQMLQNHFDVQQVRKNPNVFGVYLPQQSTATEQMDQCPLPLPPDDGARSTNESKGLHNVARLFEPYKDLATAGASGGSRALLH